MYRSAERDACGVLSKYVLAVTIFAAVMICGHIILIAADMCKVGEVCFTPGGVGWACSVVGSFVFSWVAIGFYVSSDGDNCSTVFPAMYKMSLANIIILVVAVGAPACYMLCQGGFRGLVEFLDCIFCDAPKELKNCCCGKTCCGDCCEEDENYLPEPHYNPNIVHGDNNNARRPPPPSANRNNNRNNNGRPPALVRDASLPLEDRAGRRGGGGGGGNNNRHNQRDGAGGWANGSRAPAGNPNNIRSQHSDPNAPPPAAPDAPPLVVVVPNAVAPDRNAAAPPVMIHMLLACSSLSPHQLIFSCVLCLVGRTEC